MTLQHYYYHLHINRELLLCIYLCNVDWSQLLYHQNTESINIPKISFLYSEISIELECVFCYEL